MKFVVPGLAFALVIAQRNDPRPLSAVLVTVNVPPKAAPTWKRKAKTISVAGTRPPWHTGQNRILMIPRIWHLFIARIIRLKARGKFLFFAGRAGWRYHVLT